ncbi:voltage-gated potassium channel [Gillisia mitskevichiae]|uniref:Voltage-gated potassium channel n=1 Tax=Gillisia mitskevichiae TaxID=270921 RepID=A0A495PMP4_9FLAO|nr:ion transporter [Gillisia mitskevichiae]RKS50748.1 voltage-gated potassium channel [Gillisia mitskevichiae]
MNKIHFDKDHAAWRVKLYHIIYGADTRLGKLFDVVLLILIVLSIILVMLESVSSYNIKFHDQFYIAEWIITIFFSIEYILRIITINKPKNYIFSFYGIVDLLSTIPSYIIFFVGGSNMFLAVRALRLLRVFRILKVTRYIGESQKLISALKNSRAKISIFLFAVLIICIITGTLMYLVEGPENGFTNIPLSIYWCIVTLTTVGFGDIHPLTPLGRFIASFIMIVGYGVIAVPTGIVGAEISKDMSKGDAIKPFTCVNCGEKEHKISSEFCHNCGKKLNEN